MWLNANNFDETWKKWWTVGNYRRKCIFVDKIYLNVNLNLKCKKNIFL